MDLRSLRHVAVLARVLSYTKAAEELGLTQSALSRSIQVIEQRAKVRLFDRDRGGVRVTSVGRTFAERAASLLREADDLERLLERAAEGTEGEIAFGMAPLPAAALAPAALAESLRESPGLRRQVAVRTAEALLSLLIAEKIEFFVCAERQLPDSAPVKSAVLGWFPTSLLVRAGHPLLAQGAEAAPWSFPVIVATELGQLAAARRGLAQNFEPTPAIVMEDHGALARITERSDAVWLSSAFAATEEIRDGRLQVAPAPPGWRAPRFRMLMYSLERRTLSPAAVRLSARFQAEIRKIAASAPFEANQADPQPI